MSTVMSLGLSLGRQAGTPARAQETSDQVVRGRPRLGVAVEVRSLLSLLFVVALTGCASVPLSTMWKMRSFTADQFFAKDPRELRVAFRTGDRMKTAPGDPQIAIRIEGMSRKPICYAFALAPVDPAAPTETPLEKAPAHQRWYVYGLSRQGIEAFDRARREVRVGKLDGGSFSLNASGNMDFPDDVDSVPFRIDLALDRKEGYLTLIKETTMTIDRTPASGTKEEKPAPVADC